MLLTSLYKETFSKRKTLHFRNRFGRICLTGHVFTKCVLVIGRWNNQCVSNLRQPYFGIGLAQIRIEWPEMEFCAQTLSLNKH